MAVVITDTCINCGACIDECPVEAIVDDEDNPTGEEIYYVYADKCTGLCRSVSYRGLYRLGRLRRRNDMFRK